LSSLEAALAIPCILRLTESGGSIFGACSCNNHVAAECVSDTLNIGGSITVSISSANCFLGANASTLGAFNISGGIPVIANKLSSASSNVGIDPNNPHVYGCCAL